jgi:site-specific recombinase XerD
MKLKELITQYAAFRKSMGADFESAESLLNTFCRRMGVEIEVGEIRAEQVEVFLAGTGPVNRYWRRKYDTLRGLYRYATSRGFVEQVPLPATVPKMPERFVPYIYNTDELHRLINPTSPKQIGFRKLQPHTLRAVLLLLYGAGLRIGEAVALTLQDLDLDAAVITVRDTKFHKTRLVPVGPKLNEVMAQYAAQRNKRGIRRVLTHPSSYCAGARPCPFTSCDRHSPVYANTQESGVPTVPATNPVSMI